MSNRRGHQLRITNWGQVDKTTPSGKAATALKATSIASRVLPRLQGRIGSAAERLCRKGRPPPPSPLDSPRSASAGAVERYAAPAEWMDHVRLSGTGPAPGNEGLTLVSTQAKTVRQKMDRVTAGAMDGAHVRDR